MNTPLPYGSFIGKLRREVEAHGFRFGEVLDLTDGEVRKHTHEGAHFCFIVKGAYISSVRDRESVYAASTMLFHPVGTTHRDRFHQRGGRFFTVSITLDQLNRVRDHIDLIGHSIAFADGEISWLGTRLYRELRAPDELSPVVMEGMALELLAQTVRGEIAIDKQPPRWLRLARELIHDRRVEAVTVGEIAAAVGVHPFHLTRTFRQFYGCSPGEFLRRRRIEQASTLLRESAVPLAQIAIESGFADQSQFTKSFKRCTGLTPGEYRKLLA
jgi:AraC family transcriptional regulator